jgi:thiol:disulfide interchange protein DsbD
MLGALLGGVILNLMPCVLPVLAIKVLHFAQHHESARQRHAQGIAYTLGVVMSFVLLGGALLLLRASGQELGWGFQLQSPWFVMGLSVLFTLIALSLFGLLEIGQWLPASWLSYQSHHPVINAGVSGVLAVVVASPCTAPFMGASLGLAMTLPTTLALLVFASMGVGLALPYALVSAWPRLSRYLPRPGAWMVLLRQFFGFPMLATVIWLVWVLALQTSVNTSLSLWMTLLCLAAALWALRLRSPLGYGVRVVLWLSTSALLVLTMNSIEVSTSPHNEQTTEATAITPRWQAWSQTLVDSELAQGRAVFVDFTAAWCVTCQINKRTVLSSTEVLNAFEQQHVSLLRADWTRRDPAITRALNALGRSGVPVYVLYRPKAPPVVLSELLSQADVLKLLETTP